MFNNKQLSTDITIFIITLISGLIALPFLPTNVATTMGFSNLSSFVPKTQFVFMFPLMILIVAIYFNFRSEVRKIYYIGLPLIFLILNTMFLFINIKF